MVDEPHDVVKLLAARMGSHPEEFRSKQGPYHDRWYNHISAINSYGNEADKAALNTKIRDIRMAELHEQVMDELLNGHENRRKEQEEVEYERKVLVAAAQKAQQQQAQQNAYASHLGQYNQAASTQGLSGASGVGISNSYGAITTSEPTLSASASNQIKQALGIKK